MNRSTTHKIVAIFSDLFSQKLNKIEDFDGECVNWYSDDVSVWIHTEIYDEYRLEVYCAGRLVMGATSTAEFIATMIRCIKF